MSLLLSIGGGDAEIVYRFRHSSQAVGTVHAQGPWQSEIQNLASGGLDALWIFHHDAHRAQYTAADDEGKNWSSALVFVL